MTRDVDIERILDRWFEEGPTEVADRVIDGALEIIDTTQQRRVSRVPRRYPSMPTFFKLAVAAVVVAMVGVVAFVALQPKPSAGRRHRAVLRPFRPPWRRAQRLRPHRRQHRHRRRRLRANRLRIADGDRCSARRVRRLRSHRVRRPQPEPAGSRDIGRDRLHLRADDGSTSGAGASMTAGSSEAVRSEPARPRTAWSPSTSRDSRVSPPWPPEATMPAHSPTRVASSAGATTRPASSATARRRTERRRSTSLA